MSEFKLTHDKFAEALKGGKLLGLRCESCGALIIPPKKVCPTCKSEKLEVKEYSGRGAVDIFTVIRVAPTKFAQSAPFAIGIVKLDEGPRIMGRIAIGLDKISEGKKVKASHMETDGEVGLVFVEDA
jgi:hypothetical protein